MAVTGAAGFIGSHLSEALLARGAEVVGLDSLSPAYPRERKLRNLGAALGHPDFLLHELDLAAAAAEGRLPELLAGCDAVIHLAGLAGARHRDLRALRAANVDSVTHVAEASRRAGVRKLILGSSSSVYGAMQGPTDERSVPAPLSPYGRSKLAGEQSARRLCAAAPAPALVLLRYFSVYGPRQRPDMAFQRFIEAGRAGTAMPRFGDGEQRRDFTFVSDIVAGTLAALERAAPGATYNLAAGQPVPLEEALALLARLLGDQEPAHLVARSPVPEPTLTAADISRARRELGWAPRVGLSEGLAEQVRAADASESVEDPIEAVAQ